VKISKLTSLYLRLRAQLTQIGPSLGLAWESSKAVSIAIVFLTLLSAGLPLLVAYVGKVIIDSVVAHSETSTLRWVLIEAILVAIQALVQRGLFLLKSLLGARLGLDVNLKILDKALHLELTDFENPEFYDQLTKARREASSRPVTMVSDTLQFVQNALTLCGYVALLFSFSRWAVLGLVLAAFPATLMEMRFSNLAFRLRNWRSPDTRRLNYLEYVLANDGHAKEVKALALGPMLLTRYRELGEAFYREDRDLSVKRSAWAYTLSLLALAAFYGCYLAIALLTARGSLSLGMMTLYVVAFRQGQLAFQSCLTAIGSMYEHNLYMSNLFEYLAIPTLIKPALGTQGMARGNGGIVFENVGFRYPGREQWALRQLSFTIPKGQSLALVGHNGAGKTTLIKLLTRLYDPTEGRILFDGRDLKDWDPETLRSRIAVVFQDFNRYQFTLGENIGIGSVTHREEGDRIRRALDLGGGQELLALPQGLETPLGRWFNDGVELSGGQWQKVALSRAFMREDAEVLILDEPTAALDAEAEHAVFERFSQLTKGRTSVLISHRFPTVRMADRILVLENGRLLEEGTHESLLQANGRYAQLFSLQAKGYL